MHVNMSVLPGVQILPLRDGPLLGPHFKPSSFLTSVYCAMYVPADIDGLIHSLWESSACYLLLGN